MIYSTRHINTNQKMKSHPDNRILILYHSGAGNTKFIAQLLYRKLKTNFSTEIEQISPDYEYQKLNVFTSIVLGFPTCHCEPSLSMRDFFEKLPALKNKTDVTLFTSYGLYNGDTLRIAYDMLKAKNISVKSCHDFRSPASDGVLLFPSSLKFMFRFEKSFLDKLEKMISDIENHKSLPEAKRPRTKWYVPINNLLKIFGKKEYDKMRDNLHILSERCTNCNLCVKECERGCWNEDNDKPEFRVSNCEFCLECVHHCPSRAIVFSKSMEDRPRLNRKFFNELKKTLTLPH